MSKPNPSKTGKPSAGIPKPPAKKEKKSFSLSQYIAGKEIYWVIGIIGLLAFFVLKDFLLLKKAALYKDIGSDSITFFYPFIIQMSDLWKQGIPQWSFSQGMGTNLFPFIATDIFHTFLFLLDSRNIAFGLSYMTFLKIITGGIIFYYYLNTFSITKYASLTGSILFAFCSYMMMGVCWFTNATEAVYFVFLLFAFEKFFKQNCWYWFPLAVALIASSQPFNLILDSFFLFIYAIFRYAPEKEWDLKRLLFFFFKLAGLGIAGLMISFVFFISSVQQIINSPRGSGETSYAESLSSNPVFVLTSLIEYSSFILRTFSTDMLGTAGNFKGWSNYFESPLTYTGLASLLLFPQAFIFLDKKRKIIYACCVFLIIIPVIFPYFRQLFFLFQGDYFRTLGLFISVTILFASVRALSFIEKESRLNLKLLLATLIVLLVLLYYPYHGKVSHVNTDLRKFATFFLFINSMLIYLISNAKTRMTGQIALLVSVSIEIIYFSSFSVSKRNVITSEELREKTGYNDYTVEAVNYLDSADHGFYRINKYYTSGGTAVYPSLNDAAAQGFKGTMSYFSFNQLNYIHFLQELRAIKKNDEIATRWSTGITARTFLQSMASVRYCLIKEKKVPVMQLGYDSITTLGDVSIFRNRYFLPLGFTYETCIPYKAFSGLSDLQMDISLFRAFVIEERQEKMFSDFKMLDIKDTAASMTFDDYAKYTHALKEDSLNISEFGNNFVRGTIHLKKKKLLFFSIPFDKGWSATVDGKKAGLIMVNIGFTGLLLEKGEHRVELKFQSPYLAESAALSGMSILIFGFFVWRYKRKFLLKPE